MLSTLISRASALVLLLGGVALLFASDVLLPRLVAGFPPAGAWIGQLLGASWLALAALNWLYRGSLLGGIYGRPVVMANLALHFIGAMVLVRALTRTAHPSPLWAIAALLALLALVYGWLLLRGPVKRDLEGAHAG